MSTRYPYLQAEYLVSRLLTQQNWLILCRNFRARGLEIDVIAMKESTLVAVEVKFRSLLKDELSQFENLFTPSKHKRIEKGLLIFKQKYQIKAKCLRCDLAVVYLDRGITRVRYFPNIRG